MQPVYWPELLLVFQALGMPLLGVAAGGVLARTTRDRGWLLLSLVCGARLAMTLAGILVFALLGAVLGFVLGYCGIFPVPN